ncbi:MAG: efflux RND transporter periplasmic adaptor subunit [Acidobacteriales bacterium]|nr:efflux RND transporter periplasmic adaptor subunit [Terriglobales bacterium]
MTRAVKAVFLLAAAILVASGARYVPRLYERFAATQPAPVPTTHVKRGDVAFTVTAYGNLEGGNSRMLTAPMVGSSQMILTELRKSGEPVKAGEVVARFDTTEEAYKLREAEADLAEAEQQVIQAQNEALAKEEDLNYELLRARGELKQAELEVRRNPLIALLSARQNNLALEGAHERLAKLERDYPQSKAAAKASIAIQEAARRKAKMLADTARRNIDMMTLKAPADGYINVERNSNTNFYYSGMTLPLFQVGDQIRPGMAVAQIPDLANWEVTAQIAEQDRGHLSVGQPVSLQLVSMPGREFHGKVKDVGGTTGPPWERRFACKATVDDPVAELRPGMSARIVISMETLKGVLWLPAPALFERDGRTFAYVKKDKGFSARDVQLVRRGEGQVVVTGLNEGEQVALASPDQKADSKSAGTGNAAKAVAK